MVTLVYRCETDERSISLNDEHDCYEWMAPETAATRLNGAFLRLSQAVDLAAAFDGTPPFAAVTDPYDNTCTCSETVLKQLAAYRDRDGTEQGNIDETVCFPIDERNLNEVFTSSTLSIDAE